MDQNRKQVKLAKTVRIWQAYPMRFTYFFLALLQYLTPAIADTPLNAEEFDALTLGRTITYGANGQQVGAETYLRNRQVRWAFVREECQSGYWYPEGELICFAYEDTPVHQCWRFFLQNDELRAEHADDGGTLFELPLDQELVCAGPDVGV